MALTHAWPASPLGQLSLLAAGQRRQRARDRTARLAALPGGNAGDEGSAALRRAPLRNQLLEPNLAHGRLEGFEAVRPALLEHLQVGASRGGCALGRRLDIQGLASPDEIDQRPATLALVHVAVAVEVDRNRRAVAFGVLEDDKVGLENFEVGAVDFAVAVEVDQVFDVVLGQFENGGKGIGAWRPAFGAGDRRAANGFRDLGGCLLRIRFTQEGRERGYVRGCLRGAAAQLIGVADARQRAHDVDARRRHMAAGVGKRGTLAVAAEGLDNENVAGLLVGRRFVRGRKSKWAGKFRPMRRAQTLRVVTGGGHDQDAVLVLGGQALHRARAVEDVRLDVFVLLRVLAELEAE